MIKGAVLDIERLKNPNYIFGDDYFDEVLEKIKDIRSSERIFYQKITDIYAFCSVDYDKDDELTNWKSSPSGSIRKYDVDIAKNYLDEKELKNLNRIVTMYLDYAEFQAENHNAMTMKD